MIIESCNIIMNKITSMLLSATNSIFLVSGKLNEDIVNEIYRKAASGIKVTVITSDKNWSRYLENLKKGYGKENQNKLQESVRNLNLKSNIYDRLRYIILAITISLSIVIFFRLNLDIITIILYIVFVIIDISTFIYFTKKEKDIINQLSIENENLQREINDIKTIREKLEKNLHIIESIELSFTILIADDKAVITSYTPNYNKNSFHYFQEINKSEALKIISYILNLSKS
ncbi:hypothetical protein [Acidianus manzaensis]|uniref:Uncharacterized protein n=1 Tax=Acidianus manzaensis TaxID=282676 RepID=A0A1W6JXJ1_9CREN|nr:hypothetical protein [Acidianus manzaensis]ARM74967.1 hypothetical protein B6F84_02265 [Acidianus manzaensis]